MRREGRGYRASGKTQLTSPSGRVMLLALAFILLLSGAHGIAQQSAAAGEKPGRQTEREAKRAVPCKADKAKCSTTPVAEPSPSPSPAPSPSPSPAPSPSPSPSPSSAGPSPEPSESPTVAPPPDGTQDPEPECAGSKVPAGANLATVTSSNPAGSTFCLASGTYTITATVQAKSGNAYVGAGRTRTFIKGDGVVQHLFVSASGAGFRVASLDISGGSGAGACDPQVNCGRAFKPGGPLVLHDIYCHHNDNNCVGGRDASVTMTDSECAYNGLHPKFNEEGTTRSAACIKRFGSSQTLTVRNSYIHDNFVGVWCDWCEGATFVITNSVLTDQWSKSVNWETSYGDALVRNNVIQTSNCKHNQLGGAGITNNDSRGLTVEGNTFGRNCDGIGGWRAFNAMSNDRTSMDPQAVVQNNSLLGDRLGGCALAEVVCVGND